MKKVLVVDDEADICMLLKRFLTKSGFEVETAQNGKRGLQLVEEFKPDLVMTDFRLGDITGADLLVSIKKKLPQVPVLIITGYSDIKTAISVMRQGAYDYITKPLFPDEILVTVKKALADADNEEEESTGQVSTGKSTSKRKSKFSSDYIIGNSEVSNELYRQIDLVAPTNFSVILYGESGAGKEAIAHEIHNRSHRSKKPFVAMDCGAISKELAGSELFGHEKGSFTGALQTKIGHFELANGGTLFLDEVSNLTYEIQMALLRVVQERKVRRIGSNKEIDLDVRIVVASNERLLELAKEGKFREDLYYRFNEFSMEVPALRDRKDDLMLFANAFLDSTNQELGKKIKGFSKEVVEDFMNYEWPGNLRELKNVIKRATLLSAGDYIEEKSLPFEIANFQKLREMDEEFTIRPEPDELPTVSDLDPNPSLKTVASEAEYDMILQVLRQVNFNKSKAARLLNIDRKTLYNKMKQFDMQ
ncbi:sigma-54-dependent transcriptional regulator [Persicitalea jodogahamensis]|uniref:Sigma-54-dependent Fis family transcriptional regulator n=1 Tax=Persicitalea jodogahamensis TaxID=402147 RepID=A0A8J3GBJ9_9BACT|nr:sigma-54 dependent transcriptional regulator [Persicitalea jodogahamensis]GHB77784.1 sigma-54-dependent Fis family transcriptional regulator [Persicitalea jodogahamensis]